MAKQMKSYRLEDSEIFEMRDISDALGITETDVIRLMLHAFNEYGIQDALTNKLDNCTADEWGRYAGEKGLERLISMSARGGSIQNEIRAQIWMMQ